MKRTRGQLEEMVQCAYFWCIPGSITPPQANIIQWSPQPQKSLSFQAKKGRRGTSQALDMEANPESLETAIGA